MLHAEEAEADGEKEGVAGEADEGGAGAGGAGAEVAEAVDAVLEPVFGDVAVDEGVASDARDVVDVPEPEDESEREGNGRETARTVRDCLSS